MVKIVGRTAPMQAAEAGDLSVTQLLLASGSDINTKDEEGETALTLCADQVTLKCKHCWRQELM